MPVHVVADSSAKLAGICAVLERKYKVTSELLTAAKVGRGNCRAVVVKADLRVVENIEALRTTLGSLAHVKKRIFLLDQKVNLGIAQAYALGATLVLAGPVDQAKLLAALADRSDPVVGAPVATNEDTDASSAGATAMASMFEAVATGTAIDVKGARDAGRKIAERVAEKGMSDWLTTVRRHHEGTFQHCLLVTGVAVDFGLSLGLAKRDMERLYTAAMFHDLGKATIPLAVLDKPGRLDPQERAIIETHPALGYDALKGNEEISPEVLDAVRHHHELLDGSGYPDALCAESISDIVRILTISDIFAALIEDRRYKAPMPRGQAYDILCGMQGKLEKVLVAAFKPVALDR
ncbi:HD domain-containing phosphohydrolase [Bradyrhizobium sp. dw_411]|uniref:HD-GYP domain-containing protein n=1 Tax=Bradyrhizobium sp. dw_411 TaxID=2720082 RepID=UPI001BCCC82F|nr:HD domain-containing phosphohydrolase [Bradyrhizobium sp. dw_411]